MANSNNRSVFRRAKHTWVNKLDSADRASSVHATQAEANRAAADMLKNAGGGERTTMGIHGKIVSKDTIGPGNESSTKDREH